MRLVDVSTGTVTSFGSGGALSTQPCGCEVSGLSFCDYAEGDTGACVNCSGFVSAGSCYLEDGLGDAGAADCASRCFGKGTFTTVNVAARVCDLVYLNEHALFDLSPKTVNLLLYMCSHYVHCCFFGFVSY